MIAERVVTVASSDCASWTSVWSAASGVDTPSGGGALPVVHQGVAGDEHDDDGRRGDRREHDVGGATEGGRHQRQRGVSSRRGRRREGRPT